MRKLKTLLMLLFTLGLAVLLSTAALADDAASGTCGENVTWSLEGGVLTISGTGAMDWFSSGSVPWYSQRQSIVSVVIESGVSTIGNSAFINCTNLTSVTIPNSVTNIEDQAFYNCDGLTSITIPGSVTSIGWDAFYECESLSNITIPVSVTSIGEQAFSYCSGLTEIQVATGNLAYCAVDGVLFNKAKTALIYFPEGIGAVSYAIPDSVTDIANFAFWNCSSLASITIPDGVLSIGESAFEQCRRLTSVTLPASVTSIGECAFGYCSKLTEILVANGNVSFCSVNGVLFDYKKTTLLQYPIGNDAESYEIPAGVNDIGDYAFYFSNLTSIAIPDSVTSIGSDAFDHCRNLTSVTIPDSVISIGGKAFFACSNLTSITIPDSVTTIGDWAFSYCDNLTDVYYGGNEADWNVIEIGNYNAPLTSATIHYNSTGPDSTGDTGDTDDSGDTGGTGDTEDTGNTDTSGDSGGSSSGTAPATSGDLNGDGEVNASDLTILARHVGKVELIEVLDALASADVTGDGNVDAADLTKLAQYVGKSISSLD